MTPLAYAIAVTILVAAVLAILAVFLGAPKRNDEDDEK